MKVESQIKAHIDSQTAAKCSDMQTLHQLILQVAPNCKLWFDDGKNSDNKVVTNPTIGYGMQTIKYANGKTRDFFKIGMSANTIGISIYIMGIADKAYLVNTYGKEIGKASVSGYCIKFKSLQDINSTVLVAAIRYGFENQD